jgi:hypothetical protein
VLVRAPVQALLPWRYPYARHPVFTISHNSLAVVSPLYRRSRCSLLVVGKRRVPDALTARGLQAYSAAPTACGTVPVARMRVHKR